MTLTGWLVVVVAVALTVASFVHAARLARSRDAHARTVVERERLLSALLEASPLAFVLCAETGRIVFANGEARHLFFADRDPADQNFLQLLAAAPEAIRAALLGADDEIVALTIDGQREIYHFTRRTFDYDGSAKTLLAVRPITREVARHDVDVLRKVVRLISHEVNNSLAPISSLVHSARKIVASGKVDKLEHVFRTIDERSKHLSAFISGYANLARLPRPSPRPVEWGPLLDKVSLLYPRAHVSAPAGAQGFCDPGQLEQALINLLKNASEAGGPEDAVSLEVVPQARSAAELRIADRGRGFSQESLENALLPFYTTKPGGTGVGLALVREIVQAHEGRLSLSPRDGGGALVTVWLPGPEREGDPGSRARLTLTRA